MELPSKNLRTDAHPGRLVLLGVLALLFSATVHGQTPKPNFPPPSDTTLKDGSKDGSKDDTRFGSPEAEMRSKLEIKEEKKKYDEHVARAKEISQIASQLSQDYETRKAFSSEDDKKFERLEKLTKRIRNDAGGAENHDDADKEIPAGMDQSLKKISEMADELEKQVENTPRNVISAAVIDQANKLLGLIQHIRGVNR
jgi:archaellum component FlaC